METRSSSGGRPPPARVPHPLVAHGADAARNFGGVGDAAEGGGDHVAVLEGGDEFGTQLGVVAQPVEELGPAPLGAVDSAAPGYSLKAKLVRGAGDLCGLAGGAMIAPEVVLAEGDEVFADGDDAGAGGVERDGFNLAAIDAADFDCLAHGAGEGGHLVVVRLGLELGSAGELCSGYSATAEPSLPRSLSKMEMRTLNVPKLTPATTLTEVSPYCISGKSGAPAF